MAHRKPLKSTAQKPAAKSAKPALTVYTGEATGVEEALPALYTANPPNLETLLDAWHTATVRLEQTHSVLSAEVARLTRELEAKNRELARKNRLADLGQMASHVAHEVRNSLVPVALYLSLLRRRLDADRASLDILGKIETGFTSLDATVNDLLNFTSQREPQTSSFLIGDLVAELCDSLAPQLEAQGVEVEIDVPPHIALTADRHMLRRALLNLLLNSLDAMPAGGELVITAYGGRGMLEIEVADSGPGLSEEQQQRVFEPFYTTKESGTGLGLAVVCHIAEAHGGKVIAKNCPEGGAAFTIRIPRRALEAAA
jgi:signal transduction histidine kinase